MMRDRLFFAAMIIIPLMITAAAGYSLRYEKFDTVPVVVVDEDMSEYSALLIERLSSKEGLNISIADREKAQAMLESNEAEQVFIIDDGFEEAVRNGESEGLIELVNSPSSYSSGYTGEVVAGEVLRLLTANMAANNVVRQYEKLDIKTDEDFRDEVRSFADALWDPRPLLTIDYREFRAGAAVSASHASIPAASASSAGMIIAFIMFYMIFAGGWLIEERLNGTIKRLGAANGALALSFQGSVISLFAAGTLQVLMFCAVLRLFFGIVLFSGLMSYAVLLAYMLAVIAISMFLSSALKTQAQLQAGAPVLALITGLAGGCFWNFVEMPERIKRLSLLTPQGWALRALNALLLDPADLPAAAATLPVLFSLALILLPASYIIINVQLRRG